MGVTYTRVGSKEAARVCKAHPLSPSTCLYYCFYYCQVTHLLLFVFLLKLRLALVNRGRGVCFTNKAQYKRNDSLKDILLHGISPLVKGEYNDDLEWLKLAIEKCV